MIGLDRQLWVYPGVKPYRSYAPIKQTDSALHRFSTASCSSQKDRPSRAVRGIPEGQTMMLHQLKKQQQQQQSGSIQLFGSQKQLQISAPPSARDEFGVLICTDAAAAVAAAAAAPGGNRRRLRLDEIDQIRLSGSSCGACSHHTDQWQISFG